MEQKSVKSELESEIVQALNETAAAGKGEADGRISQHGMERRTLDSHSLQVGYLVKIMIHILFEG